MAKRKKVTRRSSPTRAHARGAGGRFVKKTQRERTRDGRQLDYKKAALAAGKGATARNVAKAAGSRAKNDKNLKRMGQKVLGILRAKGELQQALSDVGFGVRQAAEHMKDRLDATKTIFFQSEGTVTDEREVIDWATRGQAFAQYMTAIGLNAMPAELERPTTPLSGLDDEAFRELLEEFAADDPESDRGGRGAAAAGGQPAQVDRASGHG